MVQKFEYKNMKYKTGRSTDTNLISNKIHCSLDFFSGKSLYTLLFIMRKSLATPQQGNGRRSMLGFGSAASKQRGIPEQKKLNFSANRSRLQNSTVGSKRFAINRDNYLL